MNEELPADQQAIAETAAAEISAALNTASDERDAIHRRLVTTSTPDPARSDEGAVRAIRLILAMRSRDQLSVDEVIAEIADRDLMGTVVAVLVRLHSHLLDQVYGDEAENVLRQTLLNNYGKGES